MIEVTDSLCDRHPWEYPSAVGCPFCRILVEQEAERLVWAERRSRPVRSHEYGALHELRGEERLDQFAFQERLPRVELGHGNAWTQRVGND